MKLSSSFIAAHFVTAGFVMTLGAGTAFAGPGATPPGGNVDANFHTVTATNTLPAGSFAEALRVTGGTWSGMTQGFLRVMNNGELTVNVPTPAAVVRLIGMFHGNANGGSARIFNNGFMGLNVLGGTLPAFIINGDAGGGLLGVWNDGSMYTKGNIAIEGGIYNPVAGQPLKVTDPQGMTVAGKTVVNGDITSTGDVKASGDVSGANGSFATNLDGTYISGYHLKVSKLGDDTWNKFWFKTIPAGGTATFKGSNVTCYGGDVAVACNFSAYREGSDAATSSDCSSGTEGTQSTDVIATRYVQDPGWDDPSSGGSCDVTLKNTRASGIICGEVSVHCLKLNGGP